jgi:hypothetical protein
MSMNSKIRKLASQLPYFPRTDSKGKLVITYQYKLGKELLKKDPNALDGNKNPIKPDTRYKVPVVPCADHFMNLKDAHTKDPENGLKKYCDMVQEYNRKKENNTN